MSHISLGNINSALCEPLPTIPSEMMISPSPPSPVITSTIVSPPTPAPSPRPDLKSDIHPYSASSSRPCTIFDDEFDFTRDVRSAFERLDAPARKRFLAELIQACDIDQLVFISNTIAPRLKRDFLRELPIEISLHVLSFIDDPRTLARASGVSRFWRNILSDEYTWKIMCSKHNFVVSAREAYRLYNEASRSGGLASGVSTTALASLTEPGSSSPIWEVASSSSTLLPEPPNSSRMSVDGDSDAEPSNPPATSTTDEESSIQSSLPQSNPLLASTSTLSTSSSSTVAIPRSARTNRPIIESKRALAAKNKKLRLPTRLDEQFSYKRHFKMAYLTEANWRRGGRVLKSHTSADDGVVTSVAMNDEWIVAGLVNHRIHVFAADTGLHVRTLVGHTQGVWCLNLVSRGGSPAAATRLSSTKPPSSFGTAESSSDGGLSPGIMSQWDSFTMDEGTSPPKRPLYGSHLTPSDVCNASVGWGQNMSLVVSGGCDRDLRVWDTSTGVCLQSLRGHTSTIRCLKVLDGRPIAVTGSRDATLRVWDIQRGRCLHLLSGHTNSVRCLDVAGNIAVSGSYDCTARLWNVDTGECLRVFEGHYHQIYAVAFDGLRVATGSLDSTVRVWSPETGECSAVLQGHTSLVGQLQLNGDTLVSGGSDGRVIIFSLTTFETLNRLCAHDNSVTCLQFDDRFLITGGNDGHVKLFEMGSGVPIRELTEPCEAVWRVNFKHDKCVIMCKRGGKTVMEILSFRPPEDQI